MTIHEKNERIKFLKEQLILMNNISDEIISDKKEKLAKIEKELTKLRAGVSIVAIRNDFKNRCGNKQFFSLGSEYTDELKIEFIAKERALIDDQIKNKWQLVQETFGISDELKITKKVRLSFLRKK